MRSAQRSMCAAMLVLQAVVLGLTTPVMISVSDVGVGTALSVGLGLTVACLLTAGLLRHRWAFALGWAIQLASLALGLVVTMMFLLGVVFAALWAGAYLLGARVDTERAERERLQREWAASQGGPAAD
jgi:hypothetical protein